MNWVLEHGRLPENVYKFCKENKLSESEFYQHYASLEAVEKAIFVEFFNKTLELLHASESYQGYSAQEKLLSFYYTFFELLTANRSYVLQALPATPVDIGKLEKMSSLRKAFRGFAAEIFEGYTKTEIKRLEKVKAEAFQEAAWVQLLFTMRFWVKDESKGFEKTDIFIEKAIKASFDLAENPPLKSVLDLGKFLYKEAIA